MPQHGIYTSRSINSYKISKEIYNYLLPVYGLSAKIESGNKNNYPCITERSNGYFFYGNTYEYAEMLQRIKFIN